MANTFTQLAYHIVFSTKNRQPLIRESLQEELYEYIGGIVRKIDGKQLQVGGMPDHIHIIMLLKPTHMLADVVKTIKAKSSKWINQQVATKSKFAWQTGYGAFTVSASQLPVAIKYVQNQAEHHKTTTYKEEFEALLNKHGIEFDDKYLLG